MSRKLSSSMMLFGGGVLGAGLALLFAPHSGAKSRKKLMRFGKDMGKRRDRMVRSVNDSMMEFAGTMNSMGRKAGAMMPRW